MKSINKAVFLIFAILIAAFVQAQEQLAPAVVPAPEDPTKRQSTIKLQQFEGLVLSTLRQQFPRIPGIFTSVHSCRLPDYGPVITVTLQPPPYYFTRPVLLELERRQRIAEAQAKKIRDQIDRAALIIKMKAKEAELLEKISLEATSKKKGKSPVGGSQKDLEDVRKSLKSLEMTPQAETSLVAVVDPLYDMNLESMMTANYQELVDKITSVMRNILAENGSLLADLAESEKISITAHIRDNFLGNQDKNIICVLNGSDAHAYRNGSLSLIALKDKIFVKREKQE